MRKLISVVLILALNGCLDTTNYSKAFGTAEITDILTPYSTTVGTVVSFQIRIKGPNSCWSKLKANMVTVDSKHLRFDGGGTFETFGTCDETVVLMTDTIIKFKPTLPGKIYLQANLDPYPIIKDSLLVTN